MTNGMATGFAAIAASIVSFSIGAQTIPADCSAATIPSTAAKGSIAGADFVPQSVELQQTGEIRMKGAYDQYRLAFQGIDKPFPPLEASVTVAVPRGQRPDGRVYRMLPTEEGQKQPSVEPGLPEVQGWVISRREPKHRYSHVDYVGSLRLEYGQRKGNLITGKMYLCVHRGQTSPLGTPTVIPSYVAGSFTASIK
jgi:hypothetical protein